MSSHSATLAGRAAGRSARLLGRAAQILRGENLDDHRVNGERRLLRNVGRRVGPGAVFFDVGANVGRWSIEAARVAPSGHVYAFEPHPRTHAELVTATAGLHNVSCHNLALGAEVGTASLHFDPDLTVLSSLHQRQLESFGLALDHAVEVQVDTVDGFCAKHRIGRVDLVKIDVEGHELATVQGARESLEAGRLGIVQFEYGGTYLDAGVRLGDVVRTFPNHYEVFRLVPWGLTPITAEDLRHESFLLSNYAAVLRPSAGTQVRLV